jgi:hypothetical protein
VANRIAKQLVGQVVVGKYPAANYEGVPARYEERRVLVERVRDRNDDDLDPVTLALDPKLVRGRILITGRDLDKQKERTFYLDRFVSLRVDPPNRHRDAKSPLHAVVIVPKPEGWEPNGPNDLPPGMEIVHRRTRDDAAAFARGFNESELEQPAGYWAAIG